MRRILILILCLMMLTGCGANTQTPATPTPSPAPTPEPPASDDPTPPAVDEPTPPQAILLETGRDSGTTGNLKYIPNEHIESMACPELCMFGSDLLVYEYTRLGSLSLKLISLADGSLIASASYPMTPSVRVQAGKDSIGLCDSGRVVILNGMLEVQADYTVDTEGESGYLDRTQQTLYVLAFDKGVMCCDLTTGQTRWIVYNAANVQRLGKDTDYLLFSYVDRGDQKIYTRCLDLAVGETEELPLRGTVRSGVRADELWLLRRDIVSGEYILHRDGEAAAFSRFEGSVELLSHRQHLLVTDESYRELTLYDSSGGFVSQCILSDTEYASIGTEPVWSDLWQGYFFRDTYDNAAHLMFWDTGIVQVGEDLALSPVEADTDTEYDSDNALHKRARELSERFGIDIRVAEQCALDYTHYEAVALTDPSLVSSRLDILERALSRYPEGFFGQLPYGYLSHIRIELVAELRAKEGIDSHPDAVRGFAQSSDDCYVIVLNGLSFNETTIYHEFSHIIDKRLDWDSSLRYDALFSEAAWKELQPEGFDYAYSYSDMPNATAKFENSGYFVSQYAMTYPTEDRATLMALAISDGEALKDSPAMAEKMRYYAACIRDCFDTDGWPDTAPWE